MLCYVQTQWEKIAYFTEGKSEGKTWQNNWLRELAKVELKMPTTGTEGIKIVEVKSKRP